MTPIENDEQLEKTIGRIISLESMHEIDSVKFHELELLRLAVKLYKEKPLFTKPCPFCAGKKTTQKLDRKRGAYITCDTCLSSGPYGDSAEGAVMKWNTRP